MFSNWFRIRKRIDTAKVHKNSKKIAELEITREGFKKEIAEIEKKKRKIKDDIRKLLEDQY